MKKIYQRYGLMFVLSLSSAFSTDILHVVEKNNELVSRHSSVYCPGDKLHILEKSGGFIPDLFSAFYANPINFLKNHIEFLASAREHGTLVSFLEAEGAIKAMNDLIFKKNIDSTKLTDDNRQDLWSAILNIRLYEKSQDKFYIQEPYLDFISTTTTNDYNYFATIFFMNVAASVIVDNHSTHFLSNQSLMSVFIKNIQSKTIYIESVEFQNYIKKFSDKDYVDLLPKDYRDVIDAYQNPRVYKDIKDSWVIEFAKSLDQQKLRDEDFYSNTPVHYSNWEYLTPTAVVDFVPFNETYIGAIHDATSFLSNYSIAHLESYRSRVSTYKFTLVRINSGSEELRETYKNIIDIRRKEDKFYENNSNLSLNDTDLVHEIYKELTDLIDFKKKRYLSSDNNSSIHKLILASQYSRRIDGIHLKPQ